VCCCCCSVLLWGRCCACSISVTAERWVPIEEVKEAALLSWLATKQAQGWVGQHVHVTVLQTMFPCV
jgi:hypothetical protein